MRYREITESKIVNEAEELPYEVQDQMRELHHALNQLWNLEKDRKYLPAIVQNQIPVVLANASASRNQLADALALLWKHADQYEVPSALRSSVRGQLIYLGKL